MIFVMVLFILLFSTFRNVYCVTSDNAEDLYWTKNIHTGDKYISASIVTSENQDLILVGSTYYFGKTCRSDIALLRMTQKGEILWGYGYGRDDPVGVFDTLSTSSGRVAESKNGNIVTVSSGKVDPDYDVYDLYYQIFSKNGTLITSKRFGRGSGGSVEFLYGKDSVNGTNIFVVQAVDPSDWASYHIILDEEGNLVKVFEMKGTSHTYPRGFHCASSVCYETGVHTTTYYGYVVKYNLDHETKMLEKEASYEFDRYWNSQIIALRNGDAFLAGTSLATDEVIIFRFDGSSNERAWMTKMKDQTLSFNYISGLTELEDGSIMFRIYNLTFYFYYIVSGEDGTLIRSFFVDPLRDSIVNFLHLGDGSGQYLGFGYPDSTVMITKGDLFNDSSTHICSDMNNFRPNEGVHFDDILGTSEFTSWDPFTTTYEVRNDYFYFFDLPIKMLSFHGESGVMTEVIEGEHQDISFPSEFSHFDCFNHKIWCFGITRVNYTYVCSGHGECVDQNNCTCETDYYGDECEQFQCYGKTWDDPGVCSGSNGSCDSVNNCSCSPGYFGDQCELWNCDDVLYNDTLKVCRGHGSCVRPDNCVCEDYYNSSVYCDWKCGEYDHFETSYVCEEHGLCIGHDNCSCNIGYYGEVCEYHSCFGIEQHDTSDVCNGNGVCIQSDSCQCFLGYSSSDLLSRDGQCDDYFCGDWYKDDVEVCGEHGDCVGHKDCECYEGYYGDYCGEWNCAKFRFDDSQVCSGHGECTELDTCVCEKGFDGDECQINTYLTTIVTPAVSVLGISISGILCCLLGCGVFVYCCCCFCMVCMLFLCLSSLLVRQGKKMKKFEKLDNVDLLLQEQQLDKDTSIAHLRVNRSLFEVNFDEVKIESILGEGGSNSVVYLGSFHNEKVAFKCFKTRLLCESQNKFSEFEREVEIMSSVNHPSLVQFYGATLKPPRVGILMEFCENGEILNFIVNYSKKSDDESDDDSGEDEESDVLYPLVERIRMMKEIISGMLYLHSRSIIHRDLKCENVLLDERERCKIVDFGISRIISQTIISSGGGKTKRIGTNVYMAPEMVNGMDYGCKVDVFSFGIMVWMVVSDPYPYGSSVENMNIEFKVSQNPDFRPSVSTFRSCLKKLLVKDDDDDDDDDAYENYQWIVDVMKRCWRDSDFSRPSFDDLSKIFEEHEQMNKK